MAEHTPWKVIPGYYDSSLEASEFPHGPEIWENDTAICCFPLYGEEKAEFIVRAVNSHQALVEALEAVEAALDCNRPDLMPFQGEILAVLKLAKE